MATYQEQLARNAALREAKAKADEREKANKLTPEQIAKLRKVLVPFIGIVAFLATDEQIQAFANKFLDEFAAEYGQMK
ncbi:MAG: hypothetical protein ACYDBH_00320 [Acidobacteriaceae bacterium]